MKWVNGNLLIFCVAATLMCPTVASAQGGDSRWAILLAGISGDPDLQREYLSEIRDLAATIKGPLGFRQDHVFVLFDDPSQDSTLIQYKSTREEFEKVCRTVALQSTRNDTVLLLILGHGSMEGDQYKLNLVGPDPSAEQIATALDEIPAFRTVVINTTNCSGGGLPALSRNGRIVLTATKSGMERNQTHLAGYFIEAFKDNRADVDKDGRVSILEAYNYASQKVEEYYAAEGSLQTEHPQLDDNGDGQGQSKPGPQNGEGLLARSTFLDLGVAAAARGQAAPGSEGLAEEAASLQQQIEALKYAKAGMDQAEYEQKLEDLLLRLAEVNAKLHNKK
jgi:hypothetical protein